MGNPCRNVEVITNKFWNERNCLQTGNFIFVVVGAVDEVFFFLPKGKEWKMDIIWAFGFGSSVFRCLLSLSLSLSVCLSLSLLLLPFLRHIHFFLSKRERGGGLDIIDDAKFWRVVQCVCVWGGGGLFVCPKVSFLSCFLPCGERKIMLCWFLFLILKKRGCQSLRDLALFWVIIFFFFFLVCTHKYGVSLNQNGAQYMRGKQSWFYTKTNFTLSCHYSKFHNSEIRLILRWFITWALAQFRSSEIQSSETNEKWICLCVFLFLYFWT